MWSSAAGCPPGGGASESLPARQRPRPESEPRPTFPLSPSAPSPSLSPSRLPCQNPCPVSEPLLGPQRPSTSPQRPSPSPQSPFPESEPRTSSCYPLPHPQETAQQRQEVGLAGALGSWGRHHPSQGLRAQGRCVGGRDPEPARPPAGSCGHAPSSWPRPLLLTPAPLPPSRETPFARGPCGQLGSAPAEPARREGRRRGGLQDAVPPGSEAEVHSLPVRVSRYYGNSPDARGGSALANWAFIPHPIIAIQFCRMRLPLK